MSAQPRSARLSALLFLLLGVLAYSNTLRVPFILDDTFNIVENPAIRLTSFSGPDLWRTLTAEPMPTRPLAYLSFALNYLAHGYWLPGYHLVNLAIHIVTGFLLYLLFAKTLALAGATDDTDRFPNAAFWAALLWLLHPLQTNGVTYIVQRMTSMSALFYLTAMLCYLAGRTSAAPGRRLGWYAATGLAGLAALASKEIAATLPLTLFLYEWYFLQHLDRAWLKARLPLLAAVATAFALLALFFLGAHPLATIRATYAHRSFTLGERLLTEPRVIFLYLGLLGLPLPSRLTLEHDIAVSHALFTPPTTALAIIGLAALVVAAAGIRRRQPLLSFAIVWFLVNLVIESSAIGLELVFEHRLYLPTMFLFLAAVTSCHRWCTAPRLRLFLLVALATTLCLWTWQRNQVWTDPIRFWSDCVAKAPAKSRPRNELGLAYYDQDRLTEALPLFAEAARLDPSNADAFYNMANVLCRTGRYPEAAPAYVAALRLTPTDPDIHNNLGYVLEQLGQRRQAFRQYQLALELDPGHPEARRNLRRLLDH